jgi:hypothetical protein
MEVLMPANAIPFKRATAGIGPASRFMEQNKNKPSRARELKNTHVSTEGLGRRLTIDGMLEPWLALLCDLGVCIGVFPAP